MAADSQAGEGGSLARTMALMTAGVILSRVTGVVRLSVMAAVFGITETRLTDTYNLANHVPNIIYELVLGGLITGIFVPLFVELRQKENDDRAWEVMNGVLNVSLLILAAVALIGVVGAPLIAHFYSSRLSGPDAELQQRVITTLLRLFIPQLVLYALYFVGSAILNSHRRFVWPMFTPVINNLVLIVVFLAFNELHGTVSLSTVTTPQLLLIGLGTTLSVAPMGLLLIPSLRQLGPYRPTLALDHPAVRKLGRLAGYVVGFVAANQVGYVVIQWLSNAQRGGFSAWVSAWTFYLLPIGLFVWSITTAISPRLSSMFSRLDHDSFRGALATGIRSVVFLLSPATVVYLIMAKPIVRLLFERGVVTAASVDLVTDVLMRMALALVPFGLYQLLTRSFYAMQDTRTPFCINCGVIAIIVATGVPMFRFFGVSGLAVGQAIAFTAGLVAQIKVLSPRIGGVDGARVARSGGLVLAASAAMAAATWAAGIAIDATLSASPAHDLLAVAVPMTVGATTYIAVASAAHMEEFGYLRSVLRRRAEGPA